MSTIDLIILGFLAERDLNPYDIASTIADNQLYRMIKISTPAVYKRCKGLAAEGLLDGKAVKKSARPGKTVYRLNAKGKARFRELMEHHSAQFTPFFLDCNAFVANLERVDKAQGLRLLANLQVALQQWQVWLVQHEREVAAHIPFPNRAIIKQYRMMFAALGEWVAEVIADYRALKVTSRTSPVRT